MTVVVETSAGRVEGITQDGLRVFKGIPFAAPPIGRLRWRAPEPVEPWTGVRQARSFGNASPQITPGVPEDTPPDQRLLSDSLAVKEPQSEDCLYLNVWTPGLDDARRPVMVWIHGGGFQTGAGSLPLYDGGTLSARGDVVVVTINYRMGPFGFLNLNEVTGGRIPATGNEGLLDQIAALEWVRDNITAFGGDPSNVTVFGESAGGISVDCLLAMPRAQGLFHKAVSQSGPAGLVYHRLETAVRFAERFLDVLAIGTSDVDALYSATTERLFDAALEMIPRQAAVPDHQLGRLFMKPVADGKVLPTMPIEAIANGSADGIPMIVGYTQDEMKVYGMDPVIAGLDEAGLVEQFQRLSPNWNARATVDVFRRARAKSGAPTTPSELFVAIETDRATRIPALRLVEAAQHRGNPAYHYVVTWCSPLFGGILGAMHTIELGFLFGTHDSSESMKMVHGTGPAADAFARRIQDAWLAFAHTGNPSCESLGEWPVYGERRVTMVLGEECGLEEAVLEEERRAWDSVPDAVVGWN
jgi:para-nitrobenzyl esterase